VCDLDVTAGFSLAFLHGNNLFVSFNIAQGYFNGDGFLGSFSL